MKGRLSAAVMRSVGITVFFIILVFVFTWPLGIRSGSSMYGFKDYVGDPMGTMWWMWWYRYAWENGVDSGFVPIVGYPFGMSFRGLPVAPLLNYPVAGLNFFIRNEVLTYNVFVLLGIFLTALCMFWLVRWMTKDFMAGLLAGIIFGFCPNQLMHSAQHLGFTLNFWIPLYVLCLFRLKDVPSRKNALLCSISGVGLVLTNYYYGYFMLIFTIVFLLFWRDKFKYFFWGGIIGFVILAPFVIPLLLRHGDGTVFAHPIGDLFKYSARWYDYFLPSEFHPIFGRCAQKVSRHYFERSLYLGYLPIVLGLWAIVRKKDLTVRFFGVTAVLFFVFSVSSIFYVGAYKLLPMFRVYARMGGLVIFAVAVLAGYGLMGIRSRWIRGGFIVLLLFEYLNFPPFHNVDLSKIPDVYEWLAGEPEDIVVVEYPFVRSIDAKHSEYLFWQRVHRKRLVNGASEGTIGDAFRKECQSLQRLETAKLLAYLGANYVIVHDGVDGADDNPGLEFVKGFCDGKVYRVIAKPGDLITIFWKDFGSPEKWEDGSYWRWMGNNATIWIAMGKDRNVDMRFKILPFAMDRDLVISVNDAVVRRMKVMGVDKPDLAEWVELKGIPLKEGANVVKFYSPQGDTRIGDVLKNEDKRRVCFGISGFEVVY